MRARAAKALTAILLAALLHGAAAAAQEGAAPPAPAAADESVFRATLPLDIATASFYELVAWARSLGLAESGSAAELRSRLYEHYGLEAPAAAEAGGMIVTIERAARASYFKLAEAPGGIVLASGGVVLAISDPEGATHRLEADEITYDRERGAVTARGSVRYERSSKAGTEIFAGEALSASLDDWSGVFIDGEVRRAGEGAKQGDQGLSISAETMLKRSGDLLVLENGVISSCDAEDPHYAIRAGRMWILGEKDWAVSNALFSVGELPLLWIPFFFYPGDELVFHPVFGYRSREGRFVQTTTYLIGKKPKKAETTSIFKLAGQGSAPEGPMELKGLFLRRSSEPEAADKAKDGSSLKVMLDLYSGLGAYAGAQGSFAKIGPLDKLGFGLGLGLSRSLFPVGNGLYSPYVDSGGWKSVWNGASFLGVEQPLRFGLDLTGSLRAGPVSASFSLPLMSDPFFNQDYKNRSEDMDWMGFLDPTKESAASTASKTSSFSQSATMSFSFAPKTLGPWLRSIDVTRLGASMSWLSATLPLASYGGSAILYNVDPEREFFYPSLLRPVDLALGLRGSLFSYPEQQAPPAAGSAAAASAGAAAAKPPAPELRSPWDEGGAPEDTGGAAAATPAPGGFRLPKRAPSAPAKAGSSQSWTASVDWSLSPSAYLEDSYRTKEWITPSEIDLALLYALISYRVAAALDAKASYGGGLASASLGLSYAEQDQGRTYLYEEAPYVDKAAALKLADDQYKSRKIASSLRLSSKPLSSNWLWAASSVNYSLDANLYALKYSSQAAGSDFPYVEDFLSWDSSSITSHSAGITLAARPRNLNQSLGLTMSLPPTIESYSARLALDGGPVDLSVSERLHRDSAASPYSFDPISASLAFARESWPTVSDTFVFDPEAGAPVSNVATLAWGPFSASLTARKAIAYEPIASGWQAVGAESFRASGLSMALKGALKSKEGSSAAWSLAGNASLSQSFLRFSESSLALGLTASLKIKGVLDISLTSQSQNSSLWRYYPAFFRTATDLSGYWVPFYTDLWRSISIWDTEELTKGLFKLKSLSLKASRDLHDWDLAAELSVKPLLKTEMSPPRYVLDPSFSLLLSWRDIPEIKTKALYDNAKGFRY